MRKVLVFLLAASLMSCSNEDNEEQVVNIESEIVKDVFDETKKTDYDVLLSEYSQLIGNTLKVDDAKLFVDNTMSNLTTYGDKISISLLTGNFKGIKKNENGKLANSKSFKTNPFISSLKSEYLKNTKNYKHISSNAIMNSKNSSSNKQNDDTLDVFLQNLADQNLEIYMPSKELENVVNEDVYYISYAPSYFTKTNEAYKYDNTLLAKGSANSQVVEIDDEFTENNNVYLVKPIDECDFMVEMKSSYNTNYCGGSGGGGGNPPDPIENDAELLKFNVDHTSIEEKDILSTRIGWFRVNGTDWMGFAGSHQKLVIHRGSPDGTTISGGQIVPGANGYTVAKFKITRRTARKKNWRQVNVEFDDDWQLSENEQAIAVFTEHGLKGEASTELQVKSSYKVDEGKLVPTTEPTVSSKVTAKESAAKFRDKRELSRRQVLSTIIGSGVTGKTLTDDGVEYNVKVAGKFQYVLKHYYTEI